MAEIKVMGNTNEVAEENTQAVEHEDVTPVQVVKPVPTYVEDLVDTEDSDDANKEEDAPIFLSLEDILGKDTDELTAEKQGHFVTEKLGAVPFTAISYDDYKQAKKDCVSYSQDDNGVIQTKVDDDKLMTKIVILAVDKDPRSNFTFASKALLEKLGVVTAEGALGKLLSPGEVVNFAVAVQNASGFGNKAKKKVKDSVKNS